jgi:predicted Zn-dependent protease
MRTQPILPFLVGLLIAISVVSKIAAASPPQSVRTASDRDTNAIGKRTVARSPSLIALEKERAEGRQIAEEVERMSRILDDPFLNEYLVRLGAKLTQNSDSRTQITIRVIDSKVPGAFVLSGGYLYIHSGSILQMENEGELAGVIAHSIAHTILGFSTQNPLGDVFPTYTDDVILPGGWAGFGIYEGFADIPPAMLLKYQRDKIFDSDYFGLQYLYESGYDPDCFIRFVGRMGQTPASGKRGRAILKPDPPSSERVKAMTKEVVEILPPRGAVIVSSSDFEAFKDRVRILQLAQPQLRQSGLEYDPNL